MPKRTVSVKWASEASWASVHVRVEVPEQTRFGSSDETKTTVPTGVPALVPLIEASSTTWLIVFVPVFVNVNW